MAGVLKNAFTVGSFTVLSRVLGLGREMLQSRLMGAGMEQSAFVLAFAIPNTMRKLFGEGALTAAFVPVFRDTLENGGRREAEQLARAVLTTVLLTLGGMVASLLAASACLSRFIESERALLAVDLCSILLPYMFAICGAAFGMGVLNSLGRFKASGFMPALLNIVWIAALTILLFMPGMSLAERARFMSFAVLAGGFLQMFFMFACMYRSGIRPLPVFSGWKSPKVALVWRNLGIGALGAGAVQINYMIDQVLAQIASPWAASAISYAERLMDLPLGVIGVSFGTVLLPAFSGYFAKGDTAGARSVFVRSVDSQMFLMLPAAAGLFVLSGEITSLVYEGGNFTAADTSRVSRALGIYALGLGFFGMQKSLTAWYQAQKDMKTPLKVSLAGVCLNLVLNVMAVFLLPVEYRHAGLAASTVFSALMSVGILSFIARRSSGGSMFNIGYIVRLTVASLLMAGSVCTARRFLPEWISGIPLLAVLIAAGCVSYALFSVLLKTFDVKTALCVFQSKRKEKT